MIDRTRMIAARTQFCSSQRIYRAYVFALVRPGLELPVVPADRTRPAAITNWSSAELELLIEEGRRQSDRQLADLSDIRGRAQWLFTVAAAALAALGAGLAARAPSLWPTGLWIVALVVLTYGVGGAASVMVSRADFMVIHTAVLSAAGRPVQRSLAEAYARMMNTGEDTVATRVTVFRQAVVFCLLGGYLGLIASLI